MWNCSITSPSKASFNHAGDAGDIIYSLPTIRALGGGDLLLSQNDFTRVKMSERAVENLRPLLELQPYIRSVQLHRGQSCKYDLNSWRYRPHSEYCAMETLALRHLRMFGLDPAIIEVPWLKVKPRRVYEVIINRTERYRNPVFPWQDVVAKYKGKIGFLGSSSEYGEFVDKFGCVKHVRWVPTENLLDAAQVIAGSKLFIGNQSCPYAMAEGMKHRTIQETWPKSPDCVFPRKNAQYCPGERVDLPEI